MSSTNRKQLELLPSAQPHVEAVTPDLVARVRRLPTFLRAWNYAQDLSALEDKQVYQPLEIDASHWTKIRSGRASPPSDERFVRFLDVVQNEIPLVWLAESRGYDWMSIKRHCSDNERRQRELQQENADLRRLLALAMERRA